MRAHRRSVQRWLDDLQAAGIVAHEPEKDGDGLWWRTQLVLLAAPEPSDAELRTVARVALAAGARASARAGGARAGRRASGRSAGAAACPLELPGPRARRRVSAAHTTLVGEPQVDAQIALAALDTTSDASLRSASCVGGRVGVPGASAEN